MTDSSYSSSPNVNLPGDKVAVGFIVTHTLMKMMEAAARKDTPSYVNLSIFLDNFIVQYKDSQYQKEMEELKKKNKPLGSEDHANELLRITMKLLQRSNFMPIKFYDGQLVIEEGSKDEVEKAEAKEDDV